MCNQREPNTLEEWRSAYFVVLKRANVAERERDDLRKELEIAQSFHKVAIQERDYERHCLDDMQERLAKAHDLLHLIHELSEGPNDYHRVAYLDREVYWELLKRVREG